MKRLYGTLLHNHFSSEDKMAFLSGPRQVGKTTTSKTTLPDAAYLNWDVAEHRETILKGAASIYKFAGGEMLSSNKISIIFDEIHKFPRWKNLLKGFYDLYHPKVNICVTGSARLSTFKFGGDSLMGRYFPYRMHPLSVRELISSEISNEEIQSPVAIDSEKVQHLLGFGGFPEPFLRSDIRFYNRWARLRLELLFKEDLRDLTHITDIARVRTLADMLSRRTGGMLNYSNIANDLQVSVDTVRRWIDTLEELYYCYRIRPYSKKVARSLLREPKIYMWDWSIVQDPGARYENFIASHLLKLVHSLTDNGYGTYELFYLRDKEQREVDFCVTRNNEPWFILEAKMSSVELSSSLEYFQKQIEAPHAFQAVFDLPFVDKDCFTVHEPVIVPAVTLLSQLV